MEVLSPITHQARSATLFGRGMLCVVIMSLQTVAATVVSPLLAHQVGPAEFGRLASAIALCQLLTALVVVGLDQALVVVRATAANGEWARGLLVVSYLLSISLTALPWPALGGVPSSVLARCPPCS
ncbi:MAG TPA: hypothetical protein VF635_06605 [Propionibacteriaceae bacterium]